MDLELGLLGQRDVAKAADLLARAFALDPVIGYYLHPGWRRSFGFRAFFRAALLEALPHGSVYAGRSRGQLLGVAAWLPPNPPNVRASARLRLSAATVRALYPRTGSDLFAGFDGLAAHHPPEPHWYLVFVGIEPAAQRSRFGNQLLAPVLGRADAEHLICYLETPFEQTIEFYRRLGFTVTSKSEPFAAPTPIWTMVRAPSASSQQPRDSLPP